MDKVLERDKEAKLLSRIFVMLFTNLNRPLGTVRGTNKITHIISDGDILNQKTCIIRNHYMIKTTLRMRDDGALQFCSMDWHKMIS